VATAKTRTGIAATDSINTKTTTVSSKNPRNKPRQPHRSNPKQQKTPKNNKQQQKTTKPTNADLRTKTLQNLPFTINIVNLLLNMLVPF
jgi:hypothetical protein